ncbi:MAG: hypothetical protein KF830_09875 [Planctomycetes bacterium]|nr:hypothetical protein [Planctomycetota bacterium]
MPRPSSRTPSPAAWWPACLAALVLLVRAAAQVQPAPLPPPDPFGVSTRPSQPRLWLDPSWQRMPSPGDFQGFPTFPSRLAGYGNYPLPGLPGEAVDVPLLPLADPEPPGWPGWMRLRQREALPFAADLALLVQHADRVWWRRQRDDAFVPLYFHDKLRTLPVGAEVEVRQAGDFELLFHTSSRLVAHGPTELQIAALDEAAVEVELRRFTRLRLQVNGRGHRLRLPDGSQLEVDAEPAAGETAGQVLVLLQRADEPSRFGGRATIFNAGSRAVRWAHAFGAQRLDPGEILTMFLTPPPAPIGAGLVAEGGRSENDGAAITFRGGDGAALSWCGARFEVGAGRTLRLDPLQGAPFAGDAPGREKQP